MALVKTRKGKKEEYGYLRCKSFIYGRNREKNGS